jgi:hypothetical protein
VSRLARANLILFALLIAHTIDHAVNQPSRTLPASADFIGIAGFILVAASATLALRRSPLAPQASFFAGSLTALGVVAIHLLPDWWGFVSDPFWDLHANALSWLILLGLLAAALAVAAAGAAELRRVPAASTP